MNENQQKLEKLALSVEELLYRAHVNYRYICALFSVRDKLKAAEPAGKRALFPVPIGRWLLHIEELHKIDMANCIWKVYFDSNKQSTTLPELYRQIRPTLDEDFSVDLPEECNGFGASIRSLRQKYFSHSDKKGTEHEIAVDDMKIVLDAITDRFNVLCEKAHLQFPITIITEQDISNTVPNVDEVLSSMIEKEAVWVSTDQETPKELTDEEQALLDEWTKTEKD